MNGYLFVLISAVLYGIEPTLVELAILSGFSETGATLVCALISLAIFGTLGLLKRDSFRASPRQLGQMLLQGVMMALTNVLLASAYGYIPVGCATVIHFMYPSITCLVMVLLFGARLTALRAAAMGLSVAGLVCISGDIGAISLTGVALALGSALTYVVYIILTDRNAEAADMALGPRMFFVSAGSAMTMLPFAGRIFTTETPSLSAVWMLIGCGAMLAIALACFALGVDRIGATSAAFFSLFEPLTSLLVSTLVYHYTSTPIMLLGCALALGAVLCVSAADGMEAKKN